MPARLGLKPAVTTTRAALDVPDCSRGSGAHLRTLPPGLSRRQGMEVECARTGASWCSRRNCCRCGRFSRRCSRPFLHDGQGAPASGGFPNTGMPGKSWISSRTKEDGGPSSASRNTWRSRAGDCHVEQASFLGIRIIFRRPENQVKQRVVDDLGRKSVLSGTEAQHHHVIGLEALGSVHGLVGHPQARELPLKAVHVPRPVMPVASEQQDGRFFVACGRIGSDPAESGVKRGPIAFAGKGDMDRGLIGVPDRANRLADLCGVLQHEAGCNRRDLVVAAEGCPQIDALIMAEPLLEFAHDRDVRAAKAVDGLPVVADGEQLVVRRLFEESFQQPRPARRDVLELIHEDVAERALPAPGFHVLRGSVDHVMEVDFPGFGERCLVTLEDRLEQLQEGEGPGAVAGQIIYSPCQVLEGQLRTLEVLQERRHQPRERIDPALLFKNGEYLVIGDRCQRHAMIGEFPFQVRDQGAGCVFVAEGLDEGCAVVLVKLALPGHAFQVFVLVDERCGIPGLVQAEVLDVDPCFRDKKVWLVLAVPGRRGVVLVRSFVYIGHTIQVEEIGDLAFLVAFHRVPVQ